MRKNQSLRVLGLSMSDSYSSEELYAVFENEVFSAAKEMDISMLKETLKHIDDRPDEEVAPRKWWVWQQIQQKIQEEKKVFTLGLTRRKFAILLASILLLLAITALAVVLLSPKEVVESIAVPIAQNNDKDWRAERSFSPNEFSKLIIACNENGIDLEESSQIMQAIKNNEGYDEEETIMAICRIAFGGLYGEWTIKERNWFNGIIEQLGYRKAEYEEEPGPNDLTEETAREIMLNAIGTTIGQDLSLSNRNLFTFHVTYNAEPKANGAVWVMTCEIKQTDNQEYTADLDRDGNVLSVSEVKHNYNKNDQDVTCVTLSETEAVQLASDGLARETGWDVPVTDEEQYRRFVMKKGLPDQPAVWDIQFNSNSLDWGHCEVLVNDSTKKIRIIDADVGPLTADNVIARYNTQYGWYGEWNQDRWVQLSNDIQEMDADSFEGRVLKATSYIPETEGLLTRSQAEKAAYLESGIHNGDTNCAVLIDADPNPIWKFRVIPFDGSYAESIVIEIDAVTGEKLDQEYFKSDYIEFCPTYRMYTLHRTWAKLTLEEKGVIPLAGLAVIYEYGDITQDRPEDDLPIWNEIFWIPEVDDLNVSFIAQMDDLPSYYVSLNEDGLPIKIESSEDVNNDKE